MHIIAKKILSKFARLHPDAGTALDGWYRVARRALWTNINEVRAIFPHADQVGTCVVFNIGGNKFRLVTRLVYAADPDPDKPRFRGRVYIVAVLAHKV